MRNILKTFPYPFKFVLYFYWNEQKEQADCWKWRWRKKIEFVFHYYNHLMIQRVVDCVFGEKFTSDDYVINVFIAAKARFILPEASNPFEFASDSKSHCTDCRHPKLIKSNSSFSPPFFCSTCDFSST